MRHNCLWPNLILKASLDNTQASSAYDFAASIPSSVETDHCFFGGEPQKVVGLHIGDIWIKNMSFSRLESHSEWGDAYALRGKVVLKWGIHAPYPCSFGGIHKLMKWNSWKIQPHYLDCIFPLKNDYFCRSRIIEFVSIKHIYDITSQ